MPEPAAPVLGPADVAAPRFDSIETAIGHTPLVELPALSPRPGIRLLAKLEGLNPSGSVKDRIARALLADLEASGRLGPGTTILEATSGNTGIAMAMLARRRGHPLTVVLPDNVTQERRQLLTLYGAEIIESPGELGSNGSIALARRLAANDGRYVMADQYANAANPRAHYETTGPEILAACPEIDVFVAGLGTGGTLMGVGRRLREANPAVRLIAAEPLPGEQVQGLRSLADGFVPEILDPTLLDGRFLVSSTDAIRGLRALLEREGILGGVSSGAVLVAARRVAATMERGTIVLLLADGGWKYLSDGLWTRDLAELEADGETRNWW
ncbi:MAG TPA: cysteine synthase family protein [Candidatus Sulfotelmatobacter sp.]|nr:cysteine synthase family protein [Candidatus Sulfotelmatobacter sp.]